MVIKERNTCMETLLSTQPSSYKEMIKASLRLYRASFAKVIFISFPLSLIIFIPRLISDVIGQDLFLNLPALSPYRLWLVPIHLISIIFFIGIIWRMNCVIRGMHEPLIEDFSIGLRKVIYVLIATLIQSTIVFAVAIALFGLLFVLKQYFLVFHYDLFSMLLTCTLLLAQIILIIYVYTLFIFLVPIIAVENKGIFISLERSASLVWNHWWRVFSVQFTPWLAYLFLLFILRFTLGLDIHIYFLQPSPYTLGATFLHLIIFAIFIPWVAAIMLIQLKDLELRKNLTFK